MNLMRIIKSLQGKSANCFKNSIKLREKEEDRLYLLKKEKQMLSKQLTEKLFHAVCDNDVIKALKAIEEGANVNNPYYSPGFYDDYIGGRPGKWIYPLDRAESESMTLLLRNFGAKTEKELEQERIDQKAEEKRFRAQEKEIKEKQNLEFVNAFISGQ